MGWLEATQYDCKKIGNPEGEPIKILIREDVALSIKKKSKKWLGAKSFGLLIGNKYKDKNNILVYIDYIVPVGGIDHSGSRPVLTDKKWIAISERALKNKPGKEIVGWYGIRTNWGGMLTEEDQWIHQNFFRNPWQVIYLTDRKNNIENLYYWYQKRLRRCNGYYKFGEEAKGNKESCFVKLLLRSTTAMAALILSLALYIEYIHPHIISYRNENESMTDVYKEEKQKLSEQELKELKSTIYHLKNTLKSKEAEIESLRENTEQNQSDTELDSIIEDMEKDDIVIHIIEKGDTLSYISKKYYGDSSYSEALGKVNRISDYNTLIIGDYLIIPSKDEIEKWK